MNEMYWLRRFFMVTCAGAAVAFGIDHLAHGATQMGLVLIALGVAFFWPWEQFGGEEGRAEPP